MRLFEAQGYKRGTLVHYPVADGVNIEFIPMSKELET